jgi:hypothetical protein
MGMAEAQIVLTMIAQRYRLRLADDQPVEPEPTLSLRPRGEVPMTVAPL